MPLIHSASPAAIANNIRELIAAGHPQKQAVAAALRTADEAGGGKKCVKSLPSPLVVFLNRKAYGR
jgi:hypothetical protein